MKRSIIILIAISLLAFTLTAQARAQDTSPKDPYSGDLLTRSTLTGDWGGFRNEWAAKGITIDLNVTQVGQGVVNGGQSSAWQYGGRGDLTINLDSQKLGLWPDRKSTRLNSSHLGISYAVLCLKTKTTNISAAKWLCG